MKKLQKLLCLGALAILATACSIDIKVEKGPDDSETVDTNLNLLIPGAFSLVNTRGLSESQESVVNDAYVLVFSENGQLLQVAEPSYLSNVSNGEASMRVKIPLGVRNLVVMANVADLIENPDVLGIDIESVADKSYTAVMGRIVREISGKMFPSGGSMPMWGESGNVSIYTLDDGIPPISLTRSVARVDVGVGKWNDISKTWTGKDGNGIDVPFELTEIYVMRPNDTYSVAPVKTRFTAGLPSVPAGAESFSAEQSENLFKYTTSTSSISQSIYVPEADIKTPDHTEKMALVLGGRYGSGSSASYYRVDFFDNTSFMDVERNHLYRFLVTSVSGAGYSNVQTAYEARSTNMTVEVLRWNERPFDNVVVQGDKSLAVSENPVKFSALAGKSKTVLIRTNTVGGFEMSVGATRLSSNADQSVSTDHFSYTLRKTENVGEWSLQITTRNNNIAPTGTPRKDVWTIDADGLLEMPFEVEQEWSTINPTEFAITVTSSGSGSAIADHEAAVEGTTIKIQATPAVGYIFAEWRVTGAPDGFSLSEEQKLRNPVTFTMPVGEIEIEALFLDPVPEISNPAQPYFIYRDSQGYLQLGSWANGTVTYSNLMLFKFGSVVGMTQGNVNGAGFVAGDVKFNPTTKAISGWGDIPSFVAADFKGTAAATPSISDPSYHKITNIQNGKGDPCKLVGLTEQHIRAGVIDNGQWRTPTAKENIAFVGGNHPSAAGWENGGATFPLNNSTSPNGSTSLNYWSSTQVQGASGAWFPGSVTSSLNTSGAFWPAVGLRTNTNGAVSERGTNGYGRSSTPFSNANGHYIAFNGVDAYPVHNGSYSYAMPVRCVRDETYDIVMTDVTGGITMADHEVASYGTVIKVQATPNSDQAFVGWEILSGNVTLSYAQKTGNPMQFEMPAGAVEVKATFHSTIPPSEVMVVNTDGSTTIWAGSNLSANGAFAPNAADNGALFQWGRNVPLPYESGTASPWNTIDAADNQWLVGSRGPADPCPRGWRVPVQSEINSLVGNSTNIGVVWTSGAGNGFVVTPKTGKDRGKTLLLPNAGYRAVTGGNGRLNTYGYYWSATVNGTNVRHLKFASDATAGSVDNGAKTNAMSVRCVKDATSEFSVTMTTTSGGSAIAHSIESEGGTRTQIQATPSAGYLFAGWEVKSAPAGFSLNASLNPAIFAMPGGDVAIHAMFVPSEVTINGTIWAGSNLSARGVFAKNAIDYGALFQWSYYDALPYASGTSSPWHQIAKTGTTTWSSVDEPCPAGWHVPSRQQIADLIGVTGTTTGMGSQNGTYTTVSWTTGANTISNTGLRITSKADPSQVLIFPNAGTINTGTAYSRDQDCYYWSGNQSNNNQMAYNLTVYGGTPNGNVDSNNKLCAMSVRCVRGVTPQRYNVVVTAATGGEAVSDIQSAISGNSVKILATPSDDYVFIGWTNVQGITLSAAQLINPSLTITMPSAVVKMQATFAYAATTAAAPYIVYQAADGRLAVGSWAAGTVTYSNIRMFKFGSVVGMAQGAANNAEFVAGDVKFNPTGTGTTPNSITGYYAVTPFTSTDLSAGQTVSDPAYHKVANIQNGKGDPCKLVGLTPDQIRAGIIDNRTWRLPTVKENITLVGGDHSSAMAWQNDGSDFSFVESTSPNGTTTLNYWNSTNVNGAPGAYLPSSTTSSLNTNGVFLPAVGYRDYTNGKTSGIGTSGGFWSSNWNSSYARRLRFESGIVYPTYQYWNSYGWPVRCVGQTPYNVYATVSNPQGGTARIDDGTGAALVSVPRGGAARFTATPAPGYTFNGWTATGTTLTAAQAAQNPVTIIMDKTEIRLTANFR